MFDFYPFRVYFHVIDKEILLKGITHGLKIYENMPKLSVLFPLQIAQELELIPKDDNYINPYKESTILEKVSIFFSKFFPSNFVPTFSAFHYRNLLSWKQKEKVTVLKKRKRKRRRKIEAQNSVMNYEVTGKKYLLKAGTRWDSYLQNLMKNWF